MQAGSTFKIFTLIAALQDQISTQDQVRRQQPAVLRRVQDSTSTDEVSSSGKVENFADEQFGRIDLRKATGHSVNTVFAQLNIEVGPKKTKEAAIAAGLPAKGLNENYANVFGTDTVSVRDMANAYATIAAQGVRVTPYLIRSVKGGPGDLNYKVKIKKQPVFDKDAMADTIDAMTEPIKNGTAEFAQNLGTARGGQDRHHHRQQVGLVRRLHPPAGHGRRHLQGQRNRVDDQPAGVRRAHRWDGPGAHLDRLHGGRPEGPEGPGVP